MMGKIIDITMGILGIFGIGWAIWTVVLFLQGEIRFPFLVMAFITAGLPFAVIAHGNYLNRRLERLKKRKV